jgi:DNA polymerase V
LKNRITRELEFYLPEDENPLYITLSETPVHAGFPSPADDHIENKLDLKKALVKNPSTTYFARVKGDSMIGEGVSDGDILVVDKSQEPYENCIAVCYLEGEFTLKKVQIDSKGIVLMPSNPKFKPIRVEKGNDFYIWGVVKYIIKKL